MEGGAKTTMSASSLKRVVSELLKRRDRLLKFSGFIALFPGLERQWVLLVLFVLEGVGLLTTLSAKTFIYTGTANVMRSFVARLSQSESPPALPPGELSVEPNVLFVRSLHRLSDFVAQVVHALLLAPSHTLQKREVAALAERVAEKDSNDRAFFDRGLELLAQLHLVEWGESSVNVAWQGPDYFNLLGITGEELPLLQQLSEPVEALFARWRAGLRNELFNRELLYYKQLLLGEVSAEEFREIVEAFERGSGAEEGVGGGEGFGYALLKGKRRRFYLQRLATIIGRGSAPRARATWHVDFHLRQSARVARQHALIAYNFAAGGFELSCLSARRSLRLNNARLGRGDPPVLLESGALIRVAGEQFEFLLPGPPPAR